jgi:HNH endonuclease
VRACSRSFGLGESRKRQNSVGQCIYCGATESLTQEHVLPLGLGGRVTLNDASCKACATVTGRLEGGLLRGHWWSARQHYGLLSGRRKEPIPALRVKLIDADGNISEAEIPMHDNPFTMVFQFPAPSVLLGTDRDDEPFASQVFAKALRETPKFVMIDNKRTMIGPTQKIEIPVNFDAGKLSRFLAKVAHGYAISRRGLAACEEYFLPEYILGRTKGLLTFVGGNSSPIIGPLLPGGGMHRMMDRRQGEFLSIYIQLFIDRGDPPPIYEVIVGRLR